MSQKLLAFCLCVFTACVTHAQVSIDSAASTPHASAMLDIKSGTKGILIPRLTTGQRLAIVKPAAGLLVYDVYDQRFYFKAAEGGWTALLTGSDATDLKLPYNGAANAAVDLFTINQLGTHGSANFLITNPANDSSVVDIHTTGKGAGLKVALSNPGSVAAAASITNKGTGSGVSVSLTNTSNGGRAIDVAQSGVGPGVFATSAGGNAVWGITGSISAAGVIGDNTFGEAVVGRNRGGNGVGAVVGRNDSSGYGVRGFNTKDGVGVLGQSGISGGTGVGGRFENVNAANASTALQAATNGTGWAATVASSNNTEASKGLQISTAAAKGGTALKIANGAVAGSFQDPYTSNAVIDDMYLLVRTPGNLVLREAGTPLGAVVWVINFSGANVTVTNTAAGSYVIPNARAAQFICLSGVNGWAAVL